MARAEPVLSEKMKEALMHWFNTVGSGGCGGVKVATMTDLWKEHVPALLLYLKSDCEQLKGARGSSPLEVYEEAMKFMKSSKESQHMAAYLNATSAANGREIEIAKFLLLFWHELCISDSKTIERSINFMEQVNLQHTMGDAIQWMNKATEEQDFNRWFYVLFDSSFEEEELEEIGEARTPVHAGDARTPDTDESTERRTEETFTFTTPSYVPMRHSLYNNLMVTPRLSARRQLPVPNSEPRHFIAPHLPVSRGSPIAEQLNSPAMREKRREREMRSMQTKLSAAQEERDLKEIEVNDLKKNMEELFESNQQLKSKLDDRTRDLAKESRLRDEVEKEVEVLKKEKSSLAERNDNLSSSLTKHRNDYEISNSESSRCIERIEELETKLSEKLREIIDLKDEIESKRMAMDEHRDGAQKWKNQSEHLEQELNNMRESMDGMKEEWRRKDNENKNELMEIQMSNHQAIGDMNGQLMEKDAKMKEISEELEKEKMKVEEWRKKNENEMRMIREEMEKEKRIMIEEMREKKQKLDKLEEEREKMDKETEEKMRVLMKNRNDMEVKLMETEGQNISLKQKLSVSTLTGERLAQENSDLKTTNEALNRMIEQVKETIGDMEKDIKAKDAELSRMREVEEKNDEMKKKIESLMKEIVIEKEKAYTALLENDKFTAIIGKMKSEEEERNNEHDWNETLLRSEITTINEERVKAEEEWRKEMEEVRRKNEEMEREKKEKEDTMNEIMNSAASKYEELKELQFIRKNEIKKMKTLENELKKGEEAKKNYEDMKEKLERLERELANVKANGKENMDNVVAKKKELEGIIEKNEKMIDKLNEDVRVLKESGDSRVDTSMTTVRDNKRGTMMPQKTLFDFEEEPTRLYAKSNLATMKEENEEEDYVEVSNTENMRVVTDRRMEDKENDGMFMMTPANDRRQLAPIDSKRRVADIASRNAKTLPHMRSVHAVEAISPNFSQEGLREGIVRPQSARKSVLGLFGKKK